MAHYHMLDGKADCRWARVRGHGPRRIHSDCSLFEVVVSKALNGNGLIHTDLSRVGVREVTNVQLHRPSLVEEGCDKATTVS